MTFTTIEGRSASARVYGGVATNAETSVTLKQIPQAGPELQCDCELCRWASRAAPLTISSFQRLPDSRQHSVQLHSMQDYIHMLL